MVKNLSQWSNERMDQMKNTADMVADRCVNDLLASGEVGQVNLLLGRLASGQIPPNTDAFPASFKTYLEVTDDLPRHTDHSRILKAQQFFVTYGAQFGVALLCSSLPILYAGKMGGAQVLASTGKMTDHFERRASETLRFILNVGEIGGLEKNGAGLKTIRQVRLMHAAIRHFALTDTHWAESSNGLWPELIWGKPIHQEELMGTLLAFSVRATDALKKIGVPVSSDEEENWFYMWKVIGEVLGILPQNMPQNCADARLMWVQIDKRNFGYSPEGVTLTQAHVKFLQSLLPSEMANLVPTLMVELLGARYSRYLQLHESIWWEWIDDAFWLLSKVKSWFVGLSGTSEKLTEYWGKYLMESLQKHWAGPNPGAPFQIPDQPL